MEIISSLEQVKKRIASLCRQSAGTVAVDFYDETNGHGFSFAGTRAVPSASTIKVLILAELLRQVEQGLLSLEQRVTIRKEDYTGGDGILKELEPGHIFTLKELATLMIIVSDNLATNRIIGLVGMENVNALGKELGLQAARLGRRMMDSDALARGMDNWISAGDMGKLLRKIYEGTLVSQRASKLMLDILKRQQQGERLQRYLPETVPLAHKCGDLDGVENDGGIFLLPDHPYILVVLTSHMPDNRSGRETIGRISRWVWETMTGG